MTFGHFTPADLRRAVLALDPGGPLHLGLDADLYGGRPAPWYGSQRERGLAWVGEYDGPPALPAALKPLHNR